MNKTITEALTSFDQDIDINSIDMKPLLGGISKSKLFKFNANGKTYVLRLLAKDKPLESRISEISAHRIADNLDIAPKVVYIDSEENPNIVIMEFVEGRLFEREDLSNKTLLKKIMVALKEFQNYPKKFGISNKTNIDGIDDLYKRKLDKGTIYPSGFNEMLNELKEDYRLFSAGKSIIHGDLNPGNIIITKEEKIYFIDFALSGIDNPFADIGWFACILGATDKQISDILEAYLNRTPTINETKCVKFFINETNFLLATLWIGRQDERDKETLDNILASNDLKRSSEYINEGITVDHIIKQNNSLELTKYALSWFKEFRSLREAIDKMG